MTREWDVGKNDKDNKDKIRRNEDRPLGLDKRRHRSPERSPEPGSNLLFTLCCLISVMLKLLRMVIRLNVDVV